MRASCTSVWERADLAAVCRPVPSRSRSRTNRACAAALRFAAGPTGDAWGGVPIGDPGAGVTAGATLPAGGPAETAGRCAGSTRPFAQETTVSFRRPLTYSVFGTGPSPETHAKLTATGWFPRGNPRIGRKNLRRHSLRCRRLARLGRADQRGMSHHDQQHSSATGFARRSASIEQAAPEESSGIAR
jgi:hypothetical protein